MSNDSNSERVILFSAQDTSVLVALDKYREEALAANNGFQTVKETLDSEKPWHMDNARGDLMD